MGRSRDRVAPALGRPFLLLGSIWVLGLIAMASVMVFENRVDQTRRAQVTIAQIRVQQGALIYLAFSPAIAGNKDVPHREQLAQQLRVAENQYSAAVAKLPSIGDSDAADQIAAVSKRYFALVDRLGGLVLNGAGLQAAREVGRSELPGGTVAELTGALTRADVHYGAEATHSRRVAVVATVLAIAFLLAAFTVALQYSVRARRRSHLDAVTDALTGLGNRRALFADMDRGFARLGVDGPLAVGMFDLDGFKAYNDTFGHPAGDALLARLGGRLAGVVGRHGDAYRIGGDEFVVITAAAGAERVLEAAQKALSEEGDGFAIGCSVGDARFRDGITLEQALHAADQRLYAAKRSARSLRGGLAPKVA